MLNLQRGTGAAQVPWALLALYGGGWSVVAEVESEKVKEMGSRHRRHVQTH